MNVLILSKCLMVAFVTTVTLWYFVTPYIVQPHAGIINDLLTKVSVRPLTVSKPASGSPVRVENWTKWRLFVRNSGQIIYGGTSDLISLNNSKAVMHMEWRQDYEILILKDDNGGDVEVTIQAPLLSFHKWGIYNHFQTEVSDGTVRILPRFLFGIPFKTITNMYSPSGDDLLLKLPIIGIFSQSTRYDRVIIQVYMNLVTLSVIFLLWANNPPETLVKSGSSASEKKSTVDDGSADSSDVNCSPKTNGGKKVMYCSAAGDNKENRRND